MVGFRLVLLALLLTPSLTLAQPAPAPTESVTVTGVKSRQVLDQFVQSFAAPTRMTGKLARWEDGVCPVTAGLKPEFSKFITERVRAVAAQVGAPVNGALDCKTNIEIVFTTAPQALLNNIREKQPMYLGYADNGAQKAALATVTRPVQAWYTTASRDLRGNQNIDSAKSTGVAMRIQLPPPPDNAFMEFTPSGSAGSVTGSRLSDGMRSTFYNIVIVAEPNKLLDHEIGPLADYIAMLALTQLSSLDTCQQLSSIVNLLASGCSNPAQALTENDLGYLRGLYKMGADRNVRSQQAEIAYQMQQTLTGH